MEIDTVDYILKFLLASDNAVYLDTVSYGNRNMAAKVIIEQSDFFDSSVYLSDRSIPKGPFPEIDGIPILFGSSKIYESDDKIYIGADLVASAFYMLTRYEECVRKDIRDQYGRFIGAQSISCMYGFLKRPIVDEYGSLLRRCMRKVGIDILEPPSRFSHIWLTHDVDQIWSWNDAYHALRSTVKRLIHGETNPLLPFMAMYSYQKYDPIYTFPEIVEWDDRVIHKYGKDSCTSLFFFMGSDKKRELDGGYMSKPERALALAEYLEKTGCDIGYHISYAAAVDKTLLKPELERVQVLTRNAITKSRNHYLASREPSDFRELIANGILEDFSMGYADEAGFRLGTCRPVHWIDPENKAVTDLVLHPLTIMECTLDGKNYMNISDEETSFNLICEMLQKVKSHFGEVVLLWHNTSLSQSKMSYQRELYGHVLDKLMSMLGDA